MSAPPIPFVGLCKAEWTKIRGRGLAWAVLLFGLMHGLVGPGMIWGVLAVGHELGAGETDPVDFLVGADTALYLAVFPVNGFALLLLACILWAEDYSLGTMAMIFVRPVARWKVFAAKAAVAWGVGVVSLLLATVLGALFGILLLGFSGDIGMLGSAPVVGWMVDVPEDAFATAAASNSLPLGDPMGLLGRMGWIAARLGTCALILAPAVAVAALVAQVTRSPVLTLFGSLVVFVVDGFAWAIGSAWGASSLDYNELAGTLAEWTILGSRRGLFRANMDGAIGDLWPSGVLTLAYTVAFGALALWMFNRRDVT
ncbi:MAG: ABC transporter permease subunit [Proteobacteria bacterium]|nr:ABC transporter permease subunit [Pseudomonadota bacterium]